MTSGTQCSAFYLLFVTFSTLEIAITQGCHQIREIQGNLGRIRENQWEMIDLVKNQGKSGNF